MSTPLVQVENVAFRYDGDNKRAPLVLDDVSFALFPGEFVALVGHNGSGKSTLARHLNGLLTPEQGRVLVGDRITTDAPVGELARQVGYVFQNPDHQLFRASVIDELRWGPEQMGLPEAEIVPRVDDALQRFGLAEFADYHPAMLGRSGRRLIGLAAVYTMGSQLLVLDEPTGGLDRKLTQQLMATLSDLVADGHAVLLVTHDMELVAEHAERVLALRSGRLVVDGPPGALFADAALVESLGLEAPVVTRLAAELADVGMPAGVGSVAEFVAAYLRLREAL